MTILGKMFILFLGIISAIYIIIWIRIGIARIFQNSLFLIGVRKKWLLKHEKKIDNYQTRILRVYRDERTSLSNRLYHSKIDSDKYRQIVEKLNNNSNEFQKLQRRDVQ